MCPRASHAELGHIAPYLKPHVHYHCRPCPDAASAEGALEAALLAAVVQGELLSLALSAKAEGTTPPAARLGPAHASRTSSPERSKRVAPVS